MSLFKLIDNYPYYLELKTFPAQGSVGREGGEDFPVFAPMREL
jgi:hypothetical protein